MQYRQAEVNIGIPRPNEPWEENYMTHARLFNIHITKAEEPTRIF